MVVYPTQRRVISHMEDWPGSSGCGVWLSLPEYVPGKQLEAVRKLLLRLSSTS